MLIRGDFEKYGRLEFVFNCKVDYIRICRHDGKEDIAYSFLHQPISVSYDEEGTENVTLNGNAEYMCRYTPDFVGDAEIKAFSGEKEICTENIKINPSDSHGYVEVSKQDGKYFTYSDGTPFFSIGINLAFPTSYGKSDGTEFGLSGAYKFIGLRQYERWFKKCSANGVNVARVWVGHEYFCPDTENTYEFKYDRFTIIDKLFELAKKYSVKLKITLEQFRNFDYERIANSNSYDDDVFRKFNKRLYDNKKRCESANEWLTDDRWTVAWLAKVYEFAKRYSGDTAVFAIELWNEMNCVGDFEKRNDIIEWNKRVLPKVKEMFPKNLVINSLGSLDCEVWKEFYDKFCWDKSDFVQIHRYLDQGAAFDDCNDNPIEMIRGAFEKIHTEKPIFIAETGAVNNCHSGPFKYYTCDDRGIILADTVYTPVFLKSCGAGNIWHWDDRYVESKNLYGMYRPLADLVSDVDFANENFESVDMSDDKVTVILLKGKTVALGYIRNKSDNWKNTLRDMNEPETVGSFEVKIKGADDVRVLKIWENDTVSCKIVNESAVFENIRFGAMFKINVGCE